jgi:hypothetical protein
MDDSAYDTLQRFNLPEVVAISLRDFEEGDEELLQAKRNRSRIEYYFTCTPSLPLYILRNYPEVDIITYLDADLFFFSDPSPIFQELADNSVLIVGHRFPELLKNLEICGVYNVGLLCFRNNDTALECLHWWRSRCLEWCYDHSEEGRYADQKYLDDWPTRFSDVCVLQHKGAGLAPWNVINYALRSENGHIWVDNHRLVFFHFHQLQEISRWIYDPSLFRFRAHKNTILKRCIYGPYSRELRETARWMSARLAEPIPGSRSIRIIGTKEPFPGSLVRLGGFRKLREYLSRAKWISLGRQWVVIAGRLL